LTPNSREPNAELTFTQRARREQIIDATLDTVARRGCGNASLSEVAKAAETSKGVIAYHFGSRETLIAETLATLYARKNAFLEERFTQRQSAYGRLRAYLRASFEWIEQHPREAVAEWKLFSSFDTPEQKQFEKTDFRPLRELVEAFVREDQSSGKLSPGTASSIASVILAAHDGIWMQWVLDHESVDLDECLDLIMSTVEPLVRSGTKPAEIQIPEA
jgi:AcrR family transcriptional regulator